MRDPARGRFLLISLVQIGALVGACLGLVLAARAEETLGKVVGIALVIAALWVLGVVPRALARRWRSEQ
ncbi:MAG: hypothetical protein K2X73_05010 [Sphingomonas sp.]|uniref:hypothetical protein n=1 Tax=Sphingomonas sp. TaxID=28214 RepID=UPI0025E0F516|nr:hypothetical protein [Sphingomonas sp.]MBX9881315.1 hypothetical protein [Sphingomonas sp.]